MTRWNKWIWLIKKGAILFFSISFFTYSLRPVRPSRRRIWNLYLCSVLMEKWKRTLSRYPGVILVSVWRRNINLWIIVLLVAESFVSKKEQVVKGLYNKKNITIIDQIWTQAQLDTPTVIITSSKYFPKHSIHMWTSIHLPLLEKTPLIHMQDLLGLENLFTWTISYFLILFCFIFQ